MFNASLLVNRECWFSLQVRTECLHSRTATTDPILMFSVGSDDIYTVHRRFATTVNIDSDISKTFLLILNLGLCSLFIRLTVGLAGFLTVER
jgi:hypothetical protein